MYINKKTLWCFLTFIIIIGLIIFGLKIRTKSVDTTSSPKGYVALVIDDLGGNGEGMDELMKLDIPMTAAVMPFLEYTKVDAKKCHEAGLEIILHLPMEPETGSPSWLGPRAITCDKSNEEIRQIVEDGLKEVKWAKGINNHMGSKAMKDSRIMNEVLSVAKEKSIFFLDSKTGDSLVSKNIANKLNVDYFSRDVFLDNSTNLEDIEKSMEKLCHIALEKGYAIGIGHVGGQGGENTIEAIDRMSKELKKEGIEFIYLSEIKKYVK